MSETKYTQEEIRTIVDEAIRKANLSSKRELSMSEMEKVNGGVWIPPTHEEIDQEWDIVDSLWATYGRDVAQTYAFERRLISRLGGGSDQGSFGRMTTDSCRKWMHRELDGKNDYYTSTYGGP